IEQETDLTDFVPPTPHDSPLLGGHTPRSDEGGVETSTNKSLGEDASKHGRNDDQTEELNLTNGADTEVILEDKGSGEKGGSTVDHVSTVRPETKVKVYWWKKNQRSYKGKRKDQGLAQIESDADLAQRIYEEELAKLDRAQKERQKQEEATIAALTEEFDEIQARIDDQLQHFNLFQLLIQKTKVKVYLWKKNQRSYKGKRKDQGLAQIESDADLAQRIYEEELAKLDRAQKERQKQEEATIAALTEEFDEIQARIDEKKSVEPESKDKKGTRIKRVTGSTPKQKSSKKQKMMQEQESTKSDKEESADYEQENEELRMWLTLVLDEEETVDPVILSTKYPIVDWESQILGNIDMEDKHVYKIIRANENTGYHKSLSSMLKKFDRQDLVDLHRLVMKKFEDNTPEEKKYHLIKEMLEKMLNWKLEAEAESTMAFELLKFIKSQIEE
nr:hypothetical protein [Tanacetum cinerariifolium]